MYGKNLCASCRYLEVEDMDDKDDTTKKPMRQYNRFVIPPNPKFIVWVLRERHLDILFTTKVTDKHFPYTIDGKVGVCSFMHLQSTPSLERLRTNVACIFSLMSDLMPSKL